MKKESEVIQEVAERVGESKYNDYMGGAMLPRGDISAAEILNIVFGKGVLYWRKKLRSKSEEVFDKLRT